MEDPFEMELRRLVLQFKTGVRRVLASKAQSVFDQALDLDEQTPTSSPLPHNPSPIEGEHATEEAAPLSTPRTPKTRALTSKEVEAVRVRLATLVCEQPGKTGPELARIVGLPGHRVRRHLRRLVREGAIEVEAKSDGPFHHHTFRAVEPTAEPLTLVAGRSG